MSDVTTPQELREALRRARTDATCADKVDEACSVDGACMLALVGVATDRRVPAVTRVAALKKMYALHAGDGADDVLLVLRRSYGVLFACCTHSSIRSVLMPLLCRLTERHHIKAFRVRTLLALYQDTHDPSVYNLLDVYAMFWPSLLFPVDQRDESNPDVPWHAWSHALGAWMAPDIVPGLAIGMHDVRSRVPQSMCIAALVRREDVGRRVAASFGRLLAANHVRHKRPKRDVAPFDPRASALLESLCVLCAPQACLPVPLVPVLGHVVQCMGHDAVQCLAAAQPIDTWERAWRPSMRALAHLFAILPPLVWDDAVGVLLPLCHMAVMDGVSDTTSALLMHMLVRTLAFWRAIEAPGTQSLLSCLLELQDALMLDGDPSVPMYVATLEFQAVMVETHCQEACTRAFPCPFVQLATPPAMQGSIATLDRLCAQVLSMRERVVHTLDHSLDARTVDAMATALVDMLWSGRAFGQFLQRGLVVDDVMAMDRNAMAVLKHACDELRIVPFVLVASLSHGALLAPLFEQFCRTKLLPGHDIRAPITPSALRSARGAHGLPAHVPYADIRRAFLEWLAQSGADHILALLEAFIPSLQQSSSHMLHGI